uniref:Uncharacterized protein n=1 Tax=Anguilla anguilla TaxID=7936 RepID=A0A0E9XG55_ANGAN
MHTHSHPEPSCSRASSGQTNQPHTWVKVMFCLKQYG